MVSASLSDMEGIHPLTVVKLRLLVGAHLQVIPRARKKTSVVSGHSQTPSSPALTCPIRLPQREDLGSSRTNGFTLRRKRYMSVEPARRNLNIWRGSTFAKRWVYLETIDPQVPKDLTGYTAELHIIDGQSTAVITCEVDGPEGSIDLVLEAEDTYTSWRNANYELKLIGPSATSTILFGTIGSKGEAAPL